MSQMHIFLPEKATKKARKQYYAKQRGSWHGVVPVTKVVPDKKAAQARKVCRKRPLAVETEGSAPD